MFARAAIDVSRSVIGTYANSLLRDYSFLSRASLFLIFVAFRLEFYLLLRILQWLVMMVLFYNSYKMDRERDLWR